MTLHSASVDFGGSATFYAKPFDLILAATDAYTSTPTDLLPNRLFLETLETPLRFERSMVHSSVGFGALTVGSGEIVLRNTEADYDRLIRYAIDGRPVIVRFGDANGAYDDFFVVAVLTAADWHITERSVTIPVRDFGYRLEVAALPDVYAGTGGLEGGDDLAGKRKPKAYGNCPNVTPVFLIPASLIWQVSAGPVEAISAVYVRATALTPGSDHPNLTALLAATVADGTFDTCLAEGLFRIEYASEQEKGQVTADVLGDKTGGVYVDTTGPIIRRLVTVIAGFVDPDEIDTGTFDSVESDQDAEIGIYLGLDASRTVADVVAELMLGVGGWGGFRRDGRFEVGLFTIPAGDPRAIFVRGSILDIERLPLPEPINPPPWRHRVAGSRNWTVQTTDLAGSVTDERRAFLAEPWRLPEPAADPTILVAHKRAQDPEPVQAFFVDEADAAIEASRLLALYGVRRSLYSITVGTLPFSLDIGDVISVTYPRLDLVDGKLLRIVGLKEDAGARRVTIEAYG